MINDTLLYLPEIIISFMVSLYWMIIIVPTYFEKIDKSLHKFKGLLDNGNNYCRDCIYFNSNPSSNGCLLIKKRIKKKNWLYNQNINTYIDASIQNKRNKCKHYKMKGND